MSEVVLVVVNAGSEGDGAKQPLQMPALSPPALAQRSHLSPLVLRQLSSLLPHALQCAAVRPRGVTVAAALWQRARAFVLDERARDGHNDAQATSLATTLHLYCLQRRRVVPPAGWASATLPPASDSVVLPAPDLDLVRNLTSFELGFPLAVIFTAQVATVHCLGIDLRTGSAQADSPRPEARA